MKECKIFILLVAWQRGLPWNIRVHILNEANSIGQDSAELLLIYTCGTIQAKSSCVQDHVPSITVPLHAGRTYIWSDICFTSGRRIVPVGWLHIYSSTVHNFIAASLKIIGFTDAIVRCADCEDTS